MEAFSSLKRLCLNPPYGHSTVIPREFLGGPTLASRRLRYIALKGISTPTLPQLLSFSRGLIRLYLGKNVLTDKGYLSPAVLTAALSTAVGLELLHVYLLSKIHDEQRSTESGLPLPKLVVLPVLTHFELQVEGSNKYLEGLASVILGPLRERILLASSGNMLNPRTSCSSPNLSPAQNALVRYHFKLLLPWRTTA